MSQPTNSIEYQEFLRAMCDKHALHSDENLKSVFDAIDEEQKGFINVDDIKNFIFKKKEIDENIFIDYLNRIGMDLHSQIKFNDFVDIIREKKLASFIKTKYDIKLSKIKEKEEEEKNKEDDIQVEEEKNNKE